AHPETHFTWIDIEDESDALGPVALDVENFPTLLIARGSTLRFFGTVLPHAATLSRTLEAARHGVLTPAVDGLDADLLTRLHSIGESVAS
ncbi:MAG: thioredoxin, partial [Caldimonas sp.]